MLDAEAIDAAVLDVNLKGQKSYPVADALAARGVPFVFSIGYNNDSLPNSYQSFPVLQKPFDRLKLGDTLAKLCAHNPPRSDSLVEALKQSKYLK